jgi:hypothetical protein
LLRRFGRRIDSIDGSPLLVMTLDRQNERERETAAIQPFQFCKMLDDRLLDSAAAAALLPMKKVIGPAQPVLRL